MIAVTSQKQTITRPDHIHQQHWDEWVIGSGVDPEIVARNIRSLDDPREIDRTLNLNAHRRWKHWEHGGGWMVRGVEPATGEVWMQGVQFKPDAPVPHLDKDGNPKIKKDGTPEYQKYLSPFGYDAQPLFLENGKDDYWRQVLNDASIPITITEGAKKAGAGLTADIATISIPGVTTGQKLGRLKEQLALFCTTGRTVYLAFDADVMIKPQVQKALDQLGRIISSLGAVVRIVQLPQETKGLDDYLVAHGTEALGTLIDEAIPFEEWRSKIAKLEKQFSQGDKPEKQKRLPPRRAAKELVERYREQWKYDLERQTWRHWDKVWKAAPDEVFTQAVYRDLEALPNVDYDSFSYIENVVKFLKVELLERQWLSFNRMEWIAFNDCVLEVKTGKTHPHSPGFGFISCLEHNYFKLVAIESNSALLDHLRLNAPTFYSWATYSQKGDPLKVLKLLATCNGVLKFRFFDLQMFVLLIGVPGSGKGTFARLLESMVGKQNCASAKLHRLGDDNVLAAIIDKQLVICPDEKKQAISDYSGLLSLTGGDSIPYRPIYKPQASGKFYGTLVTVSNSYVFYGDTTGIDRRECPHNFDVPLLDRDTSVEVKMQAEVGQIMAIALSMPDQQVTDLIKGTGESAIPDLKRQQWVHKTENDSVALFMEESLMQTSPTDFIVLGGEGNDPSTLYGAYLKLCEDNKSKSLFTRNNFRGHLLEICRDIGWSGVRAARQGNGWRIYGMRLRQIEDNVPRISDWLSGKECRVCRPSVDPSVDLKPLLDKESVGCVGLTPPLSREKDFNLSSSPPLTEVESSTQTSKSCDDDIPTSQVYTPTQPSQDKGLTPTQLNTEVYTPYTDPIAGTPQPEDERLSQPSPEDQAAVKALAPKSPIPQPDEWVCTAFTPQPTLQRANPAELPTPTAEQINIDSEVWVFRVIDKEWLPGLIEDIDEDWCGKPCQWEVRLTTGQRLTARSLEQLRTR